MASEKTSLDEVDLTKPAIRRRMEFIDFRLFWYGRFSRKDFVDAFGRSPQQASADIADYLRLAPKNAIYDAGTKSYLRRESYRPLVMSETVDRYLMQLYGIETALIDREVTWLSELPATEVVGLKRKPIRYDILQGILDGVRECQELEINYSSISSGTIKKRWIAPHALFYNAGKWYVRAWSRERNDFRDFNIGRISEVYGSRPCPSVKDDDFEWKITVDLKLSANPKLGPDQKWAIENEYNMDDGILTLNVRLKTAFYIINEYNLDLNEGQISAQKQQLVLQNISDISAKGALAREMSQDALRRKFPELLSSD